MGLSTELISEFVKITNDNKKGKEDNTVYGTVKTVSEDGKTGTVKIDGSDELTPITTTCSIRGEDNSDPDNPYPGDRVRLTVRNHSAIVTGNVSDQSIGVRRAGSIEASIKNLGDALEFQVSDKEGSLASKITMVSNRIDSEVLDTTNGNSLASKVSQMPDQIESSVKATYIDPINTAISGEGGLNARLASAESIIKQMPDQIVSRVASTYITNEGGINSKITEFSEFKQTFDTFEFITSGGKVKIASGNLQLTGAISFGDLTDATTKQSEITNALSVANSASSTASSAKTTANSAKSIANGVASDLANLMFVDEDGDITTYIDGGMIASDSIYADSIHLGGSLKVYKTLTGTTVGGYLGYDSGFNSSSGIGIRASDTGAQMVCTNNAARLSYGNDSSFVANSDGYSYIDGSVIIFEIDGDGVVAVTDHGSYYSLRPYSTSENSNYPTHLGTASKRWGAVYATNGTIQTSDRNLKHDIEDLPDKYVTMFDHIRPRRFKMNEGSSGRYHVGYIAQEVEEAMAVAGIDSLEFGGFVKDVDDDGTDIYMLRYDEFNAIHSAKLKQLEARVAALEER